MNEYDTIENKIRDKENNNVLKVIYLLKTTTTTQFNLSLTFSFIQMNLKWDNLNFQKNHCLELTNLIDVLVSIG